MEVAAPFVAVRDIALHFGHPERPVLRDVSFSMAPGEIVGILGASGCGKTSLLNVIAGFVTAQSGEIFIQGASSMSPSSDKAMVFQEHALFPWLKVWENVAFGLKARGVPKRERRRLAEGMLAMVGLEGCGEMLPEELSGGMKQRVALARVLVLRPGLLLMDEPFAALDALTREDMHELLLSLHQELRPAVLFVTHDVTEAVKLADRVLVFGKDAGGVTADEEIDLPRPRDMEHPDTRAFIVRLRTLLREDARNNGNDCGC